MIKGDLYKKRILYLLTYKAPNIAAPKYIKQILTDLKGEIDRNTIIVGDFTMSLTYINGQIILTENQ